MLINSELAAYGMFQIAFAALDTRLSWTLFAISVCEGEGLSFESIRRETFGRRLDTLEKLRKRLAHKLKRADASPRAIDADLDELTRACDAARSVQNWRNGRIHAKVMFSDEGAPVLIQNGRRLRLDREECEQRIHEAVKAGLAIETLAKYIVAILQDIKTFKVD
jgi:hypothetical protein